MTSIKRGAGNGSALRALLLLPLGACATVPLERPPLEFHASEGLVRAWNEIRCRPPLADQEVIRTVNSVAKREAAQRGPRA